MPRLQSRSFEHPDEVRNLPKAAARIVHLDEVAVGLVEWEPGWRWSVDLAPIAGTEWCQNHHLGFAISGALDVITEDGDHLEVRGSSAYEIPAGHDAWVVGDEPFVTVEWTSARVVGVAPEDAGERVLATVLFTDIVESTSTLQRIGDARWRELLLQHNTRLREVIDAYRGREIATTGDGFLVTFDGPTRAVRAAAAMVHAAEKLGLEIRVGIHTGEIEVIAGNVRGIAVHAAARILAMAGPGEVLVSEATRALVEGSGLDLEDAGRHALKGLSGDRQLYRFAARSTAGEPPHGA